MKRRYNQPILAPIVAPIVPPIQMYIPVSHTNGQSIMIKDTIGVVMHRLVGVGLYKGVVTNYGEGGATKREGGGGT